MKIKNFVAQYLLVLLFLSLLTWLLWRKFEFTLAGIDDANIFFVYAKNLANGHGFVYNVGGERVEGFTSLLWVVLAALAFKFAPNPEFSLLIFNILIVALGITAVLLFIQSALFSPEDGRIVKTTWSVAFLLLLLTSPSYLVWNTLTLMENGFWSTLLLLTTVFVLNKNISPRRIYLIFIPLALLLLLTRPESFLWITVFSAILLVRLVMIHGVASAVNKMLPVIATLILAVVALTTFRLSYFGYPLPNTFYAKVSPSLSYNLGQGKIYFFDYFFSNIIVSIAIVAMVLSGLHTVFLLFERKLSGNGLLYLPVIPATGLLIPVLTGGDHFRLFRFYQGIYPLLLLCLFYFLRSILPQYIRINFFTKTPKWSQRIFIFVMLLLFATTFLQSQYRSWGNFGVGKNKMMWSEFDLAQSKRETGRIMVDMFDSLPELPRIGTVAAGGIKYNYHGVVIDLMGLNNTLMAHNGGSRKGVKNHAAFDKATFYQLDPDIVAPDIVSQEQWQNDMIDLQNGWRNDFFFNGLYDDPLFSDSYLYVKIDSGEEITEKSLVGWFKEELIDDLRNDSNLTISIYDYQMRLK